MREDIIHLIANALRIVSAEMVERAKSGHPGAPMGMAEIVATLWGKIIKVNPEDPLWQNRDRFILSAGHASALLYSILHLAGFDIKKEDLMNFRQWESKTPGHPEVNQRLGIECTTGPLGQGFAMGVGMAIAKRILSEIFNKPGYELLDHYVYAIVSDGDLMEGVSREASSIAGHLGLGELIYIYDSNGVTIDGSTNLTFSEDIMKVFDGMGWHTEEIDGHDVSAIYQAIKEAQLVTDRPSLIIAHTKIGKGSPTKEGSHITHGSPLGEEEVEALKQKFGWELPPYEFPEPVKKFFEKRRLEWKHEYEKWLQKFGEYSNKFKEEASMWNDFFSKKIPEDLERYFPKYEAGREIATREASGDVIQILAEKIKNLVGGSADLAGSVKTVMKKYGFIERGNFKGRNIHFGVREHAMGGILNGIALYGGLIPFGGTFLVFSDYLRPAIRISALMSTKVIYVFSHDSVFVGEDGPTHQPVEHLASLRAIPNLTVIRPADANEVPYAWEIAIKREGPTAIVLSRQGVKVIDRTKYASASLIRYGGYIIAGDSEEPTDLIIFSSGSEVSLSLDVYELLKQNGVYARVVNMASWEIFEEQQEEYIKRINPDYSVVPRRVFIEAGVSFGLSKYAGPDALYITVDDFGKSAPYKIIKEKLGFTAEKIVQKIFEKWPSLKKS